MLLSCVPCLTAAAEGETITAASNLEITTVDGLKAFRDAVNTGIDYAGYTVSLKNDISLNSEAWTPIGVYRENDQEKKPFKGTFNGKGHTIRGLNATGDNAGLFGYVLSDIINSTTPATIKNLTVEGSITPTGNAGGIVAYLEGKGSTVSCCHSDVAIEGTGGKSSSVGGIVGYNLSGTVSNCYSTGKISGDYNVGGVVGWNYTGGTVSCCHYYNTESNSVSINGGQAIGAIIGENDGDVYSCRYLEGTAVNGIGKYQGVETQTSEVDDLTKDEFKNTSSFPSSSDHSWDFARIWSLEKNDSYPVLRYSLYAELTDHIKNIEQLELLRDAVNAGASIVNNYDCYYLDNDLDLSSITNWEPIGTSVNPFTKIFTGWDPDTNKEAVRIITGLKIDTSSDNQGLFGYNSGGTIKNLTLSKCNVSGGGYVGGLVGQNNGTIQNITVDGTVTGSGDNVGGIVGYSNNSSNVDSITECINSAAVKGIVNNFGSELTGSDSVGGIVGYNEKGTVTHCHTTKESKVIDGINVGGIVGKNEGKVQLCYNSGKVGNNASECRNTGGVVGSNDNANAVIENCYNTAAVSGYVVGGVLGINIGEIRNCYSNGTAYGGNSSCGGVVGTNNSGGKITSCYFLKNEGYSTNVVDNNQGNTPTDSKELSASEFIDETKFKDWDFNNPSIWTISNSAGAPVFFDLKVGNIEKQIGYWVEKDNDATGFAIHLLSDGTTLEELYIKGTVSLDDKHQSFDAMSVGTNITAPEITVGLVVEGLYDEHAVLAVQAMIK